MLIVSSYKFHLFLALLMIFLHASWTYANETKTQNDLLLTDLNHHSVQEIASLPHLHPQKKEFIYYAPGHIRYQHLLNNGREVFAEFSGLLDQDDPLEEFTDYLRDPVNWDPTQIIDRRFIYEANVGIHQHINIFNTHASVLLGLAAHAENGHVHYVTPTNTRSTGAINHLNLIDIRYAPYLTLRTTPVDWITFHGDARMHVLHFDTQNVCSRTCSIQPNNFKDRIFPNVQGTLRIHAGQDITAFMHAGTGYHSFQERELIGSTAVEQLNRVTSYHIGIHTTVSEGIEIRAALWQADLNSDRVFFEQGEKIQMTGPSRRRGLQLMADLQMPGNLVVSGNLRYEKTSLRSTGRNIPLNPGMSIEASLKKYWGHRWTSTFSIRHNGHKIDNENQGTSRQRVTTFDLTTNYQLTESAKGYHGEIFLGIVNLSNADSPYTRLSFEPPFDSADIQEFTIQYFPGQTRTIVGGMTWTY